MVPIWNGSSNIEYWNGSSNKSPHRTMFSWESWPSSKPRISQSISDQHSSPGPSVTPGSSRNTILASHCFHSSHILDLTLGTGAGTSLVKLTPIHCPSKHRQPLDNQPRVSWDREHNYPDSRRGRAIHMTESFSHHGKSYRSTNSLPDLLRLTRSWDRSQVCILLVLARFPLK